MELLDELLEIPQALNDLIGFYERGEGQAMLPPRQEQVLLTGMGASYHAAMIGSFMLQHLGIGGHAIEAIDMLFSETYHFAPFQSLIYISQSGGSGEILPVLSKFGNQEDCIAITNDEASPLAQGCAHVLSMRAGKERWIASKTYLNTLASLWIMANRWAGRDSARTLKDVKAVLEEIGRLFENSSQSHAQYEEIFDRARPVIFLGQGAHAVTAREAAMTLAEWPKLICQSYGAGTLRHGFIETVDRDSAVVLFAPQGRSQSSTLSLAKELSGYGAKVWVIDNGRMSRFSAYAPMETMTPELLSPMLDIVPVQLFAEAYARKHSEQPGFRYLSKVVTTI